MLVYIPNKQGNFGRIYNFTIEMENNKVCAFNSWKSFHYIKFKINTPSETRIFHRLVLMKESKRANI